MNHTPKPWMFLEKHPDVMDMAHYAGDIVKLEEGNPHRIEHDICQIPWRGFSKTEHRADAYVLEAAPDLLEACQGALGWIDKGQYNAEDDQVVMDELRAAIAKATRQE